MSRVKMEVCGERVISDKMKKQIIMLGDARVNYNLRIKKLINKELAHINYIIFDERNSGEAVELPETSSSSCKLRND